MGQHRATQKKNVGQSFSEGSTLNGHSGGRLPEKAKKEKGKPAKRTIGKFQL